MTTTFLPRFGLFLARCCTSAWIGAATLFVVVGVIEVTRGQFDSTTKDALVALRFPAYYVCGAALIGGAWLGSLLAGNLDLFPRGRRIATLVLLAMVIAVMVVDYVFVYLPLLGMVVPPGQAKPASFRSYHEASKWINLAGLLICLVATLLINWPAESKGSQAQTTP